MVIAVDFDWTLVYGTEYPDVDYRLMPGAKDAINELARKHELVLSTARKGWYRWSAIAFVRSSGLPIRVPLSARKPKADVYIDDCNIGCRGIDWNEVLAEIAKMDNEKELKAMYYCCKEMEIDAAHRLELTYESPCQRLHGHCWRVKVYCKSEELDENGMVYDFKKLKDATHGKLDHRFINEVVDFNPTAENLAKWMADQVGEKCYKVEVWESRGNLAWWERDDV